MEQWKLASKNDIFNLKNGDKLRFVYECIIDIGEHPFFENEDEYDEYMSDEEALQIFKSINFSKDLYFHDEHPKVYKLILDYFTKYLYKDNNKLILHIPYTITIENEDKIDIYLNDGYYQLDGNCFDENFISNNLYYPAGVAIFTWEDFAPSLIFDGDDKVYFGVNNNEHTGINSVGQVSILKKKIIY